MKPIEDIEGLLSGNLGVMKALFSLIKLEARLAGLSIAPLLISLVMLLIVIATIWATAMLMLGLGFYYLFNNALAASGLTLLVNIIILAILSKVIFTNIKHMSFEKTRNFFSQYYPKESENHEFKEGTTRSYSRNGEKISVRTDAGDTP
ncbi:hypothetical protein Lade_2089 [Legionella adelaidensis]|uniref:Transmembrane protein n=1 Tax=Legionella adelaidensis TaxID=45056 RepID=A0A0W0R1E6_9GAMM|nr:hypothetical protein [Legionella adelaidensis]KTC64795.1 hypothetical protein Lade_2089 [Legionella adelaidensis]